MRNENLYYDLCRMYLIVTRFFYSLTKTFDIHLGSFIRYRDTSGFVVGSLIRRSDHARMYRVKLLDTGEIKVVHSRSIRKYDPFAHLVYDATFWWCHYRDTWLDLDALAMSRGKDLPSKKTLFDENY